MKNYHIAIIGNGIAAAAALITLNQCRAQKPDLSIALIAPDKSPENNSSQSKSPQSKPLHLVGESLPPSIKPLLQKLDLWPSFTQANFSISRSRFTAWESQTLQPNFAPQQAEGFGWCIDRVKFEQLIWQQANICPYTSINGIYKNSHYCQQQNSWQLGYKKPNKETSTINAELVLDCTGKAASFAKQYAKREKCQPMLALCDFLAPKNNEVERTSGVMIEAVADGWWYSTLLPSGYLAIAYFTLRHMLDKQLSKNNQSWQKLIAQSNYTQQRIETGEFATNTLPKVHDTTSSLLLQKPNQTWLACGDAALALDPLSAHGMSTALWSGHKSALALVAKLTRSNYALQEYIESCTTNWHIYREQRANLYQLVSSQAAKSQAAQGFAHSEFWQTFN